MAKCDATENLTDEAVDRLGLMATVAMKDEDAIDQDGGVWVFGYGSLIFKPMPFEHTHCLWAKIEGYVRRFWQGSWDHRGTVASPGRVVTLLKHEEYNQVCKRVKKSLLLPSPEEYTWGRVYRIGAKDHKDLFQYLDYREKGGYTRELTTAICENGKSVRCVVYRATLENDQFLGPDQLEAMAQHIYHSHGPSGANQEYLLRLHDALSDAGLLDAHVRDLAQQVRSLQQKKFLSIKPPSH